jgi:hypothetical protein
MWDLCESAAGLDRGLRWWVPAQWRPPRTVFVGRGGSDPVWTRRALLPAREPVRDPWDVEEGDEEQEGGEWNEEGGMGHVSDSESDARSGTSADSLYDSGSDSGDDADAGDARDSAARLSARAERSGDREWRRLRQRWQLPPAVVSDDPTGWPDRDRGRGGYNSSTNSNSGWGDKARASLPPRARRCGQHGAVSALAPSGYSGGAGVSAAGAGAGDGGVLLAAGSLADAVAVYDLRIGASVALLRCFDRPPAGTSAAPGAAARVRERGVSALRWTGAWRLAAGFRRGAQIEVWDVRTLRRPLCALPRPAHGCQRLALDADASGRWLLSGAGAGAGALLWDLDAALPDAAATAETVATKATHAWAQQAGAPQAGARHCNASGDCGYDVSTLPAPAALAAIGAGVTAAAAVTGAAALHPEWEPERCPIIATGAGTRDVGSAWAASDSDCDSSGRENDIGAAAAAAARRAARARARAVEGDTADADQGVKLWWVGGLRA